MIGRGTETTVYSYEILNQNIAIKVFENENRAL